MNVDAQATSRIVNTMSALHAAALRDSVLAMWLQRIRWSSWDPRAALAHLGGEPS